MSSLEGVSVQGPCPHLQGGMVCSGPSSPSGNPGSLWKLEKARKPEGKGPCHHLDFSPVWFGQNDKKMNLCYLKPLCLWQFVTAATGVRVDTNIRLEATRGGVVVRPGSGRKEQSLVCGC